MNVVNVKICGVEYNLKGNEKEEYLHKVAIYVDKKVNEVLKINSKLSTGQAAVLAAANAVDDMFKMKDDYEALVEKLKEVSSEQKALQEEIEVLKMKVSNEQKLNEELKKKVSSQSDNNKPVLKHKEIDNLKKELGNLKEEYEILQQSTKTYLMENTEVKKENRDLRIELQAAKLKIVDLQQRLEDREINLAKVMKQSKPFINSKKHS